MPKTLTVIFSLVAIAIFATACDRDTEIAGISSGTQLSEFSTEQSDVYCGYLGEKLGELEKDEELQRSACLMGGVMAAVFAGEDEATQAAACEEAVDECMVEMADEGMGLDEEAEEMCFTEEDLSSCEATLGELDTCLDAALDWALSSVRELSEYSCTDLVGDEGMEKLEAATENMQDMEEIPDIEECQVILEKCPDLS